MDATYRRTPLSADRGIPCFVAEPTPAPRRSASTGSRGDSCASPGHWIKRYIFFHHKCQWLQMGERELNAFLSHLAVQERVSASTQNQALGGCCSAIATSSSETLAPFGRSFVPSDPGAFRWARPGTRFRSCSPSFLPTNG